MVPKNCMTEVGIDLIRVVPWAVPSVRQSSRLVEFVRREKSWVWFWAIEKSRVFC
jgi:hypothetical protein